MIANVSCEGIDGKTKNAALVARRNRGGELVGAFALHNNVTDIERSVCEVRLGRVA